MSRASVVGRTGVTVKLRGGELTRHYRKDCHGLCKRKDRMVRWYLSYAIKLTDTPTFFSKYSVNIRHRTSGYASSVRPSDSKMLVDGPKPFFSDDRQSKPVTRRSTN